MLYTHVVPWDIETGPLPENVIESFFDSVKPDRRIKDPAKIAANIAEKRQAMMEEATLKPHLSKVLAIACGEHIFHSATDEAGVLNDFWDVIHSAHNKGGALFVGYCSAGFDLPFVMKRSWALGVHMPDWVFDGRYTHKSFVDAAIVLACGRREDIVSLDVAARLLGIGKKSGNGADFWREYLSGDDARRDAALAYCSHDKELTLGIAMKLHMETMFSQ